MPVMVSGPVPVLRMDMVCTGTVPMGTSLKATVEATSISPSIEGCGCALGVMELSPSSPFEFFPQAHNEPDAFGATVWPPPLPASTQSVAWLSS